MFKKQDFSAKKISLKKETVVKLNSMDLSIIKTGAKGGDTKTKSNGKCMGLIPGGSDNLVPSY